MNLLEICLGKLFFGTNIRNRIYKNVSRPNSFDGSLRGSLPFTKLLKNLKPNSFDDCVRGKLIFGKYTILDIG